MSTFNWRFAACFVAFLPVVGTAAGEPADRVPGRVLVKFSSRTTEYQALSAVASLGGSLGGEVGDTGYRIVELPSTSSNRPEVAAAMTLSTAQDVDDVQYDRRLAPSAVPNDPAFGSEWHLPKIACPGAWNGTHGSRSVIVAILDTGVDGTHPDLAAKMVAGWNTYNNNSNTADVYGHGTAVAGTAAATGGNGVGVVGVAWDCSIMPVRISDSAGYGYSSTVSAGLTWAADHGARVANISYGFSNDPVVKAAAKNFSDRGGVVTISAGNSSYNDPAADNPYVLTVSATDTDDTIVYWSNTGNNVDVAAPGVSVLTTNRGGGYSSWSGTSFSAPITAGVAALVISASPSLKGPEVQQIIRASADDLGAMGWDQGYGAGRVNADRAVALALEGNTDKTPPTVSFVSPLNGSTVSGALSVNMSATDNVGVETVELRKDGALVATFSKAPFVWVYDTTKDANAQHVLLATAKDAAGNQASTSLTLTASNVDKVRPSVSFTSPSNGATVSNTVTIAISASDNKGVASVELRKDGVLVATLTSAPFTWAYNTAADANGTHSFIATAKDASGNKTSASRSLKVSNKDIVAPTVVLTSPTGVVGASFSIRAAASDNVKVVQVRFYIDGLYVGASSRAPFTFYFNKKLAKGNHTIQGKAYDAAGNVGSSPLITVSRQ